MISKLLCRLGVHRREIERMAYKVTPYNQYPGWSATLIQCQVCGRARFAYLEMAPPV